MSGGMVERVARVIKAEICKPDFDCNLIDCDRLARAAIEAMQTKCFECGEPVTLACLACQKPTT